MQLLILNLIFAGIAKEKRAILDTSYEQFLILNVTFFIYCLGVMQLM